MSESLDALVRRAEEEPFFLASLLAVFVASERMDDPGLAAFLGCSVDRLPAVKLCRAPREDVRGMNEDVEVIAGKFGLHADRLRQAVKRGQVLMKMQSVTGHSGKGTLLAAREGDEPGEETP